MAGITAAMYFVAATIRAAFPTQISAPYMVWKTAPGSAISMRDISWENLLIVMPVSVATKNDNGALHERQYSIGSRHQWN